MSEYEYIYINGQYAGFVRRGETFSFVCRSRDRGSETCNRQHRVSPQTGDRFTCWCGQQHQVERDHQRRVRTGRVSA